MATRISVDWLSAGLYAVFAACFLGLASGADRMGWRSAAMLAASLSGAFGAISAVVALLLVTGLWRHLPATPARQPELPDSGPTASDDDIIAAFSGLLQSRTAMFSPDSDLPYPKEQIHAALVRAADDPVYRVAPGSLQRVSLALDTFVPGKRLVSTNALLGTLQILAKQGDERSVSLLLAEAPDIERRAVLAVAETLAMTRPKA